eukprot:CAMPEP_0177637530 /NCGR_PEP_ID=MMETSP0447-20121125/5018_1 /TAXON_ID=0 /ORGANISM="Stygamoeba regulata, Strain BSH-02190019" /LENGTH=30 /DNA_ID= /DNA_START= /DNA_END= /DNA_ORIENTATION=
MNARHPSSSPARATTGAAPPPQTAAKPVAR